MALGAGFHQVNMNRKYWTMVRTGCVNTNDIVNLERETGIDGMAEDHMVQVPRWIANINSTMRLGFMGIIVAVVLNVIYMVETIRKRRKAEPEVGQVSSESAPSASPDEPST